MATNEIAKLLKNVNCIDTIFELENRHYCWAKF